MKALPTNLTRAEADVLRETEKGRMAELDEEELLELHKRVRRARNKHVTVYRRSGSATVSVAGGRGKARSATSRTAGKAEIFEDALARVSRRLGVVAGKEADRLKAERLEAARKEHKGSAARGRPSSSGKGGPKGSRTPSAKGSPARRKRDASTLAAGARRQAKRDAR